MTLKRCVLRSLAGLMCVAAAPTWALADAAQVPSLPERLWVLTGTFHPLVVHFPIALLLVAAVMEALRVHFKRISPDVSYFCLLFGAAGSVVAAVFGWSMAGDGWGDAAVFSHRWWGVGMTAFAVIVAVVATLARINPEAVKLRRFKTVGVFLLAGLVSLVGHLGGELTHGEGFLEKALARAFDPPIPATQEELQKAGEGIIPALTNTIQIEVDPAPSPPDTPSAAADRQGPDGQPETDETGTVTAVAAAQSVDFITQVWPIFEHKCVSCHGPDKSKGKLRMDSEQYALQGGRTKEPLWIAGDSAASLILRIIRSEDDIERMPPPEEGKEVTQAEYDLIKAWIEQGAEWPVLPVGEPVEVSALNRR